MAQPAPYPIRGHPQPLACPVLDTVSCRTPIHYPRWTCRQAGQPRTTTTQNRQADPFFHRLPRPPYPVFPDPDRGPRRGARLHPKPPYPTHPATHPRHPDPPSTPTRHPTCHPAPPTCHPRAQRRTSCPSLNHPRHPNKPLAPQPLACPVLDTVSCRTPIQYPRRTGGRAGQPKTTTTQNLQADPLFHRLPRPRSGTQERGAATPKTTIPTHPTRDSSTPTRHQTCHPAPLTCHP